MLGLGATLVASEGGSADDFDLLPFRDDDGPGDMPPELLGRLGVLLLSRLLLRFDLTGDTAFLLLIR